MTALRQAIGELAGAGAPNRELGLLLEGAAAYERGDRRRGARLMLRTLPAMRRLRGTRGAVERIVALVAPADTDQAVEALPLIGRPADEASRQRLHSARVRP